MSININYIGYNRNSVFWSQFHKNQERTGNLLFHEQYFTTPALSRDADFHLLPDGMDACWYIGADRIEVEDYIDACNQTDLQTSMTLNLSKGENTVTESWERLFLTIPATEHYRITLAGTGKVRFVVANETLAKSLDDEYEIVLRAANISLLT